MSDAASKSSTRKWALRGVSWLALCGFYLLLAANTGTRELISAVLCGTITLIFSIALHRHTEGSFWIRARDVLALWRFPAAAISGLGSLVPALLRLLRTPSAARSMLRQAPFVPSTDESVGGGRRALITIATTATPNSIVLGFDGLAMIYHQIEPAHLPEMTRQLAEHP